MHSNWIWHNTISNIKEKDDLFKNVAANWVIRCSQIEWSFGNSNDLLFEKDLRVRGSWDHTKVHKKGINPRLVPNWRSFQSRWISGSEWHFSVFQSHILKVHITDLFSLHLSENAEQNNNVSHLFSWVKNHF